MMSGTNPTGDTKPLSGMGTIPMDTPDVGPSLLSEINGAGSAPINPKALPGAFKGGGSSPNIVRSFGIIIVIAAVAGGLLYGMRRMGMSGSLEKLDIKIDYPLEQAQLAASQAEHNKVISDLKESNDVVQVPLSDLRMNPFEWKMDPQEQVDPAAEAARRQAEAVREAARQRQRQIDTAIATLQLNSVMGGSRPLAMINGQPRRLGDKLGPDDLLTIVAIEGRTVWLEADGKRYELRVN